MEVIGNNKIPIGLGMVLAKDTNAMNAFSAMSEQQRLQIIEQSRSIHSKDEMQHYVNSFTYPQTTPQTGPLDKFF